MAFAVNYHRWILERLTPFLGKRIIEVGAGVGSFSRLLLETRPELLMALEPSPNMYAALVQSLAAEDKEGVSQAHGCTLAKAKFLAQPDSIVYINVLEHIKDDEAELRTAHSMLVSGGRVLIFVPANPWLMGSMDRQLGHFRRYTRQELIAKCRSAGFIIRLASYFDVAGILPWWAMYCVLKSSRMDPAAVRLYDRWVVPIARVLENAVRPPLGKNIVLVAEK
ncbi:MAG TPA: class I SAM-dependent methyltransferase [Terriglobia bacterium]|nr:class I SAM-dependent methyltransferase [Terriglobia bacterium]